MRVERPPFQNSRRKRASAFKKKKKSPQKINLSLSSEKKIQIFPVEGCRWVARNAPRAKSVVFRGCGHWLYIELPDEFASLVASFAVGGLEGVEGGEV